MTMNFSQHDSIDPNAAFDLFEMGSFSQDNFSKITAERLYLFREKLEMPDPGEITDRPRIGDILTRSAGQFPATLVSGRAGTGRTVLAAAFSAPFDHIFWFASV